MTELAMPDVLETRIAKPVIPGKFEALLDETVPYVVLYGGRHGLKTRSACIAALVLGARRTMRIFCGREVMRSIRESLHEELSSVIETYGLNSFYRVMEKEIRGANGTRFFYGGLLEHTSESIKSLSNIDLALIDEANAVRKRSWDVFVPTIRKPGVRAFVLFNPGMADDDTYQRWVVNPLPGTQVVKSGWQDAQKHGWFPEQENEKRLHFQRTQPKDYDNVWEGATKNAREGAIFADEVDALVEDGRYVKLVYNPMVPVDTVWDLGWNDRMVVLMVQKTSPTSISVINYLEVRNMRYDGVVAILESLGYRWGVHWLPHDAEQHHPTSGTNATKQLKQLFAGKGIIRDIPKTNDIARIQAARMMFPRTLIDNTTRTPPITPTGDAHFGAARLMYALRRFRWDVPKPGRDSETARQASVPFPDEYIHAGDAFGYLAEIVDRIKGEFTAQRYARVGGFRQFDSGLGTLG